MPDSSSMTTSSLSPAAKVQRKADSLKWLSWNAAWHAANVLASCDDAARQRKHEWQCR